jgi:hypothetical protein
MAVIFRALIAVLLAMLLVPLAAQAQARKSAIVWRGTAGERTLEVVSAWDASPDDATYRVRLADAPGAKVREVALPDVKGRLTQVSVWNRQTLLVLTGTVASLVDLASAEVIDRLDAAGVAISPDSRHVAYHPVTDTVTDDGLVRLYDVSTAAARRPRSEQPDVVATMAVRSPLKWVDAQRLVFVGDEAGRGRGGSPSLALAIVDVTAGGRNAQSRLTSFQSVAVDPDKVARPRANPVPPLGSPVASRDIKNAARVPEIRLGECTVDRCRIGLVTTDVAGQPLPVADVEF